MQQVDLPIIHKIALTPSLWQLSLHAGAINARPAPGQFYLMRCADRFSAYLRRAVFPAYSAAADGAPPTMQLALAANQLGDAGLAWLAGRRAGDKINLLGPLGRGFAVFPAAKNWLFVGDSLYAHLFLAFIRYTTRKTADIVLALEAVRRADLYPTRALPRAVELRIATRDGSQGHCGSILDHLDDLLLWTDALYAAGSPVFLRRLQALVEQKRMILSPGFAQALLVGPPIHVCGTGVCARCAVPTRSGPKLACLHGPVFDLATLVFEQSND